TRGRSLRAAGSLVRDNWSRASSSDFAIARGPGFRLAPARKLVFVTRRRASSTTPDHSKVASLSKPALHDLANGLDPVASNHAEALERCIEFVLAETEGLWHGRARAMMCRRLKHCELTPDQRRQLVSCITERLATGNFSEQFRDQLRLALHLDSRA